VKEILHSLPDYDLLVEVTRDEALPDMFCVEFKSVFRTAKNPTEERSLFKCFMTESGIRTLRYGLYSAYTYPDAES
jgi:hypothetical protein